MHISSSQSIVKKVLVFGVFDGLHEGHRDFLRQARAHGDILVVAVALDAHVRELKRRSPNLSLEERMRVLQKIDSAHVVVPGDEMLGSWGVLHEHQPHAVIVGHDQHALREALEAARPALPFHFDIIVARQFIPHHRKFQQRDGEK